MFTGFTLSQAGMTKHHLRKREKGYVRGIVANGFGGLLSAAIVGIVPITKFPDGWVVLPILPLFVVVLLRLNRQYEREQSRSKRECRPRPRRRSCGATWCWSSSTGSTWPPPEPSSTPAR